MLERWQGEPLVRRAAQTFLEARLAPVIVVVSPDPELLDALAGLAIGHVVNPHPERGISSSIAIGVQAVPEECVAATIGVADQPYLNAGALSELIQAFAPGRIAVPRYGDHRGNPAVFDRRFFPELQTVAGDCGGQGVIEAHPEAVTEIGLPPTMGEDIDRPEQWPP